MTRAVQGGILSTLWVLALIGAAGCNPLNLKLNSPSSETVQDRLKQECADSGGEWTETGCDPALPWRR